PPLVTAWWTDGPDHTVIAGPFFDRKVGSQRLGGFVPLVLYLRVPGEQLTLLPPLLTLLAETDDSSLTILGPLWANYQRRNGEHFWAVSAAITLHFGDGTTETTLVVSGYLRTHPEGWDAGLAPVFFAAQHGASHYALIPPALALHYGDAQRETTIVGPGYLHTEPDGWDAGLLPLVFAGRRGASHYALLPPLLTMHAGDQQNELTISPLW